MVADEAAPTSQADDEQVVPDDRLLWIDVVKGVAILLVVLHHSILFLDRAGFGSQLWLTLNGGFQPVRMPLFFLASGLLAKRALARSWPVLLRTKTARFLYLYALWSVLQFCWFLVVPRLYNPNGVTTVLHLVQGVYVPATTLWYLYALGLFFVLAKGLAVIRVPAAAQLAVAGVISALFAAAALTAQFAWESMAIYFFFFLGGIHGRTLILRGVRQARLIHAVALAVAFVGIGIAMRLLELHHVPGVGLLLRIAGVAFTLALVVQLMRVWLLPRILAALGQRTLPIYLLHEIIIGGVAAGLVALSIQASGWLRLIAPLGMVAIAVAGAVLIHRATRRAGFLYGLPGERRAALDRSGEDIGGPVRRLSR